MKTRDSKPHSHAKGAGYLERRASGVYVARWMKDGRRYTKSTGTKDRREAERILEDYTAIFRLRNEADRLAAMRGRMDGITGRIEELERTRPALRIADAWDAFTALPEIRMSEAREQRAGVKFEGFVRFMSAHYPETLELRQVTKNHAAEFARTLAPLAAATANDAMRICGRVWDALKDNEGAGLEGDNPFQRIPRRKEPGYTRNPFTPQDLAKICGRATGELRVLFALGIYTGLRLGDCACMTWESVDMERRIIRTTPHKTAKTSGLRVIVPIHAALYAILDETPQQARRGYVLPDMARRHGRRSLVAMIQAHLKSCGIVTNEKPEAGRGVRAHSMAGFHSLRHTFVSMAANAGASIALVQSIVGHTSAEMTRRYFHASPEALRGAVFALPNVTEGADALACGTATAHPTPRLLAFAEIAANFTPQERTAAAAYLANGGAWTGAEIPALPPPNVI